MNKIPSLKHKRQKWIAQLPDPTQWIRGSLRQAYLRCGQVQCRCHRSKRFRHGPYWYLTRTATKGKTQSALISLKHLRTIREGLKAYGKLWKGICEISEINLVLLKKGAQEGK